MYPKLPDGPAPQGAAGVRALNATGGNWQTKIVGSDVSRKMGDFSRVHTGGPRYVLFGQYASDTQNPNDSLFMRDYVYSAVKQNTNGAQTFLPGSAYYALYNATSGVTSGTSTYLNKSTDTLPTTHYWTDYIYSSYVFFNRTKYSGELILRYSVTAVDYAGLISIVPGTPRLKYVGPVTVSDGTSDVQLVSMTLVDNQRRDPYGRALYDPAILCFFKNAAETATALPVISSLGPYPEYWYPVFIVSDGFIFAVCHELTNGGYTDSTAYQPKITSLSSTDNGNNFTASDIFSVVMQNYWNTSFTGDFLQVQLYNWMVSIQVAAMVLVLCPNNLVVMCFPVLSSYIDPVSSQVVLCWIEQVAHITGGTTATLVYSATPDMAATAAYLGPRYEGPVAHLRSVVYIGNNILLAKRAKGLAREYSYVNPAIPSQGTQYAVNMDIPIEFVISTDLGASWTTLTPTGFDASFLCQYFGALTVDRLGDVDKNIDARILIPSWNPVEKAYYVYASTDKGNTWKAHGKIVKPDQFYNMENMAYDTNVSPVPTIGNFNAITSTNNDPLHPFDVSLPKRYLKPK